MASLNGKLRKDQTERFGQLAQEETVATEDLQDKVILLPVLASPCDEGEYNLDTDACGVQVGCVRLQSKNGTKRPIGYWSRFLND